MSETFRKTCIRAAFLGVVLGAVIGGGARAQDRQFNMTAPSALIETGFLKYLIPRFTLKHSTRINLGETGGANTAGAARISASPIAGARAVFSGGGATYYLAIPADNDHAARFAQWLSSDIGQNTIAGFVSDTGLEFSAAKPEPKKILRAAMPGNPIQGGAISRIKCGRCHVVDPDNRMNSIGSTPSFFALRTLDDWHERFSAFYALNPHPAFTQVAEVTPPFDPERPPPIAPLELGLEELDDILAYVAGLTPADLGAPIVHQ